LLFKLLILLNLVLLLTNQKEKAKEDKNIKNKTKINKKLLNFKISLKEKIFTKKVTLKGIFKKTKVVSQLTILKLNFLYLLIKKTINTI